jgi:DNA-binding NtrC family response regulator
LTEKVKSDKHNPDEAQASSPASSSNNRSNNQLKFFNESPDSIRHKAANRRSYVEIRREDLLKYMNCSQQYAAKMLGVSVSTLKRRFYELNMGKWPYVENKSIEKKRKIEFLLNKVCYCFYKANEIVNQRRKNVR